MNLSWLFDRMESWRDREALASDAGIVTHGDLLNAVSSWNRTLDDAGVVPSSIVAFDGDFGPSTVSLLLALIARSCVVVPLASATDAQKGDFVEIANVQFSIDCRVPAAVEIDRRGEGDPHPLLRLLIERGKPGLVLFSSGSTGKPKGMVHDFEKLLDKFKPLKTGSRILTFLLMDHIGGVNTLMFGLSQGGAIVTVSDRSPSSICQAIERHRVETLPTSPTFLNLLLLSEAYRDRDLSSLKLITYGTEVMPAGTLASLHETFPNVKLQQTYGLSEVGILRSKSRDDGSLWVKVGGEDYQTKVVNGTLRIKAKSAMLGYLNAPSPFDEEGWFDTQDAVEQDGEWLRFLGRTSEIINVGGLKVYPVEVESAVLEMSNVADVTVRGEPNPILGRCVVARVNLIEPESPLDFKARLRRHCQGRLANYMIPVKVEVVENEQYNARCKRMRNS